MDWLAILLTVSLVHASKNQIIDPVSSKNEVVLMQDQERGILPKPSAYVIGPRRTILVICRSPATRAGDTRALLLKCKGLRHNVSLEDFSTTNDDHSITTRLIVSPQVIKKHKKHIVCYCIDVSSGEKSTGLQITMKLSSESSNWSSAHFKPRRKRIRTVTLRDSITFSWRFPNSSLVRCMHDGRFVNNATVVYGEDKVSVVIHKAFREDAGLYYCMSRSGVFSPWLTLHVKGGWSEWHPWLECSAQCGPGIMVETRRCLETRQERCHGPRVRALPCVGHSCQGIVPQFVDEPADQVLNGSSANVTCAAQFGSSVFTLEMFCSSNGWRINYFMIQNTTVVDPNSTVVRLTYNIQLYRDRRGLAVVFCHCYMSTTQLAKRSRNAQISFALVYVSNKETHHSSLYIQMGVVIGCFTIMLIVLVLVAKKLGYVSWRRNSCREYQSIESQKNFASDKHRQEPKFFETETIRHVEPPATKIMTLHSSASSDEEDTIEKRASDSPLLKGDTKDLIEEGTPHPSTSEETYCDLESVFHRGESWKSNQSAYSSVSAGCCPKPNLPDTVHPDLCAWEQFTEKGGRITIKGTDVTLYIPPHALPEGTAQVIYIGLMISKETYPKLKDQEALLSPVVVCGPDGLTFEKPVFLTVPHNAVLDENNCWHPKVQSSSTADTEEEDNKWKVLERPGGDVPLSHVSDKHMQIMIDHFTNFAVVGEASSTQEASAKLKAWIIAYYTEPKIGEDLIIRIYCIPATHAAYKILESFESKINGKMSDSQKLLQICNNNKDLQVMSRKTNDGWKAFAGELKLIGFDNIWQCTEQLNNVSFVFERVDPQVFKFRSIFDARQEESTKGVEVLVCFAFQTDRRNSSGYESQANGCLIGAKYKIPIEIRCELCYLLDPEKPIKFNDWRMFAEKLGLRSVFINCLKGNSKIKSPTDEVIEYWEMSMTEDKPLSELVRILCEMERYDAVEVLQKIPGLENTSRELSC